MKVALVAGRNAFATGIDRYVSNLVSHLEKLGVEVELHVQQRRELKIGKLRIGGLASLYVQRYARRPRGVDLVHALDPAVAGPRTDIVTIHDLIPERFPEWYLKDVRARIDWSLSRRYAKRAPWLLPNSHTTRRDVLERWGVPAERVVVAHLGVDPAFAPTTERSPLLAPDKPNLVYLGDDNPRKNIGLVVDALALLKRRGVEVRFIRVGPSRFPEIHDAYRRTAREAGVDLVEPGFVADKDIPPLYTHASLFVWPSLAEGFGLPPVEAMACGLPVVALDTPIDREILGPVATFHANDAASAADAIEAALRSPRRADAQRAHAAQFSFDRTARETLAVYEQAVRAR